LTSGKGREERPMWVKVGLWKVRTRTTAWVFVGLSLVLALACAAYGTSEPFFFFIGGYLVFAALHYWLSIRWVDRHGDWS
jgi:hypothetical protein